MLSTGGEGRSQDILRRVGAEEVAGAQGPIWAGHVPGMSEEHGAGRRGRSRSVGVDVGGRRWRVSGSQT